MAVTKNRDSGVNPSSSLTTGTLRCAGMDVRTGIAQSDTNRPAARVSRKCRRFICRIVPGPALFYSELLSSAYGLRIDAICSLIQPALG